MQDPIRMEVMNAVKDLIEEGFDHRWRFYQRFFVGFCRSVEFDYVPLEVKERTR